MLLAAGAGIDTADINGDFPLHDAVGSGHLEVRHCTASECQRCHAAPHLRALQGCTGLCT